MAPSKPASSRKPGPETGPAGPAFTKADVAKRLLQLRRAQSSFPDFVRFYEPTWDLAPFQDELVQTLDRLEKDQLGTDNVLITMPPRFAKSTFASVMFPAFFMGRDPSRYVMSCSYNAQLATDFGRQVRTTVEDPKMAQIFPDLGLSKESRAADVWRTTDQGAYFAVGIGGTTSGRPANLLIVDDPIKSREDAESMTARNRTWNYYVSALATRLQPDRQGRRPKQVVVLTRWHPNDIAGRLMQTEDWKEGRWTHVNFPAIIERKTKRVIPRSHLPEDHPRYVSKLNQLQSKQRYIHETEEVSLWEDRFPLEDLKRKQRLNPREFASLYQQQPYVQGGNLIKAEWWRYYATDVRPERFAAVVIGVDTAFKKGEQTDYSVALTAGIDTTGDIYILDVMRVRVEFPDLKQRMIRLNNQWRGRGLRAFYIEDKASGQSLIQELRRESGFSLIPYKVTHDKVARTNAVLPLIEGGRVLVPEEAPWLDDFMEECVQFPGGTHDDQVDALTIVLDVLSRTGISPEMQDIRASMSQSLNNQLNRSSQLGHNGGPPLEETFGKPLSDMLRPKGNHWKGWGL